MSAPQNAITPSGFEIAPPVTFIAANGTAAKVLVEPYPAAAAAGNDPAFYGACTVLDLTASSTDGSSKDVILYRGRVATTQGAGTGAMATTSSTIPRLSGDFIADGWRVGDLVMTFAPPSLAPNAGVDGILGVVTAVAALTLTVNGTPFAALTLAAGTRIVRVRHLFRAPVAANSGTNGALVNVALLGNGLDSSLLRSEMKLGPNGMLIAAMQAAVSALPAYISIDAPVARY